ncbi:hypothetical protein SAMN05216553_104411 [Lentzea fradiae]|uniref:Uncharacterized protein n=1 Tax=Lentzea fradiae TaxID=200378 RepID=A0A1G7QEX7_9PSEU|nr:SdrD B-like domain-containing protein [Lentzea fradiae]SDF97054.1 hypothetical protein SAMN05216553_104411 [Lentzea fradiae]
MIESGAVITAALLALGAAPAAQAQEPAALRTTVELDKSHYLLHEDMRMKFTITNVGGQAAERVRFPFPQGVPGYERWDWGELKDGGNGVRIGPGETQVFEFSGGVADRYNGSNQTAGIADGWFDYIGRQDNAEDRFSALATVTPTEGDLGGVVYGDSNHNGRMDAGEALAGTLVQIWGGRGMTAQRTTGADGRFLFEKTPGGRWLVGYTHPDGWVAPNENVLITPQGADLAVRAERPAADSLGATLVLDQESYQPQQAVTMTVTLTNDGTRPIEGVQATCLDYGRKNYLGVQANWGELAPNGAGVGVPVGESRTFHVTDVVPQEAVAAGEVLAVCRFGPQVLNGKGYVEATARAAVPGGFGSVAGRLWHDRNRNYVGDEDEGVANVRVVLRDRHTDAVTGEAVSDATGMLRFDRVPAGSHRAHVEGAWTYPSPIEREVTVVADREAWLGISLEPAASDPGGPGPEQQKAKPALARTGPSAPGLALLGVLLVALGVVARVMGRNREARSGGRT